MVFRSTFSRKSCVRWLRPEARGGFGVDEVSASGALLPEELCPPAAARGSPAVGVHKVWLSSPPFPGKAASAAARGSRAIGVDEISASGVLLPEKLRPPSPASGSPAVAAHRVCRSGPPFPKRAALEGFRAGPGRPPTALPAAWRGGCALPCAAGR